MAGQMEDAQIKAILKPIGDDEGWLDRFHSVCSHDEPDDSPDAQKKIDFALDNASWQDGTKRQKNITLNGEFLHAVYWDSVDIQMLNGSSDLTRMPEFKRINTCLKDRNGRTVYNFFSDEDLYRRVIPEILDQLLEIIRHNR
jgi:hypothetical protein